MEEYEEEEVQGEYQSIKMYEGVLESMKKYKEVWEYQSTMEYQQIWGSFREYKAESECNRENKNTSKTKSERMERGSKMEYEGVSK